MKAMQLSSCLFGSNAPYIEALYESYLQDPHSVDLTWQEYFKNFIGGNGQTLKKKHEIQEQSSDIFHLEIQEEFKKLAKQPGLTANSRISLEHMIKQQAVDNLIQAYRCYGHMNAKIDPLQIEPIPDIRLTLQHYGLGEADFKLSFMTRGLLKQTEASLKEIYMTLQQYYTSTIGVDYFRLSDDTEREWIRSYVEHHMSNLHLDAAIKRNILKKLIAADTLEKYLDNKYPGQRRYSIEGADCLIPMIDHLIKKARGAQVYEMVFGMAHRGRLNMLLNIMGQSSHELFQEFEGTKKYGMTTGDVKYHMGFCSDIRTDAGPIHLSLAFNPSHLEFICPVIMGSTRARQERVPVDSMKNYALCVMIHGDAAFTGQGISMETLSMSQTRAYHIGGSIHIIINNQVGFTTSNPQDARSSHYCSDIAKMIDAPVLHVNGNDPEAVVKVVELALDYRMTFHKDIIIDLVCYRRHGHQEVDEPRATQPLMYEIISQLPTPAEIFLQRLIKEEICTEAEAKEWIADYRDHLDQGHNVVELLKEGLSEHYAANWTPFLDKSWTVKVDTTVSKNKIVNLAKTLEVLPEGFQLQRNVAMIIEARKKMAAGELAIDWGFAEILAYASLLDEGHPVRFSGEDCRRGTFFHRHSTLFDQNTGEAYTPLKHLGEHQASFQIYDSLLSEAGVVGFEYGYSTASPNALVIWEAQFGDFANVAQVYIDQFISSGWQKWNRLSGLVMFLPHGAEGLGPEHSSARLERFLQLCAQKNMQVFVPTTPAQMFHLLRRQILRPYRTPLIVMSPKSLLRHKLSVSSLEDLAHGKLHLLIPEVDNDINPKKTTRVVLTSGKIYYELLTTRREHKISDIAIIRIEQLYPFPYDELKEILSNYTKVKEIVWCQEEPKNQGAWFAIKHRLQACLPDINKDLLYAGRPAMAASAGGYASLYKSQQSALINEALNIDTIATQKNNN